MKGIKAITRVFIFLFLTTGLVSGYTALAQNIRENIRAEIQSILAKRAIAEQTNRDYIIAKFFESSTTGDFTRNGHSLKQMEADLSGPRFMVATENFHIDRLVLKGPNVVVAFVSVALKCPRLKPGRIDASDTSDYIERSYIEREVWQKGAGGWKLQRIDTISKSSNFEKAEPGDELVVPSLTQLMKAIIDGDEAAAKAALAGGVNIQAKDDKGRTALMLSVAFDRKPMARTLLDRGADVNAADSDGMTALMFAAAYNRLTILNLLLAEGASVSGRNSAGNTPLILAAIEGHGLVVEALLAGGSDVNGKGTSGQTALMAAVVKGRREVVQLLLKKGANVNARDRDGMTSLMYADANRDSNMHILLQAAGAR